MDINIEVQYLCIKQEYVRGIPYYIKNLTEALAFRNKNTYALSFFDYGRERNNREYIFRYIDKDAISRLTLNECNDLSYKAFFDGYILGSTANYDNRTYEDYIGKTYDIIHFPSVFSIPQNVKGNTLVTVHDVIPCMPGFRTNWTEESQEVFLRSIDYIKENAAITIISDSYSTKNDLVDQLGFDGNRIHVVPLAVDDKNLFYDPDISTLKSMGIEGEFILYLGELDPRKGIIDIITAFAQIKSRYADLKLVLAGGTEKIFEEQLQKALSESEYRNDIILTGYVSEKQKRVLLSYAEIFLFPSEYEGFGIPVLEAMKCKTPVITTKVSSLPEVGGDAVVYITPNQPEELSEAVCDLLGDTEKRVLLSKMGLKQCENFSWDKTAAMTEEVYQKLC